MKKYLLCLISPRDMFFCPLLVVLGLAALIMGGCQDGTTKAERPRPPVTGVKVTPVALSKVDELYETTGSIKSEQTSSVASRIMGVVTAVHVREGDRVKAGQLLVTIDNRELLQRVKGAAMATETAKSNKAMTETTWRRYQQLHAEKAVSQQEMDQVETQKKMADSEYERARAAYEEAVIHEAYARIKAPVSGVITGKKTEGGSMAVPGQPLVTIESDTALHVEAFADEALTRSLKKGMTVDISIEATNRHLQGAIRDIVPAVDPRSRTFLIKVALPAAGLKSGLYARLRIPLGKRDALLVPSGSVVSRGQLSGVYAVAPNGVMTYRLVKTGRSYPDGRIEILAGLAGNEQIVSEGAQKAVDGGVVQKNQTK